MTIPGRDFQTEVIRTFKDEYLKTIMKLEPLFPIKIQDREEKIRENLKTAANINVFLKKDEQVVGWILATPHNDAVNELRNDDTGMKEDPARYYIDKLAVIPEHRQGLIFVHLIYAMFEEANRRGFHKFSTHVLCGNGLNKVIMKLFKHTLTERRKVLLAINGNATFEYLEGNYTIEKTQHGD